MTHPPENPTCAMCESGMCGIHATPEPVQEEPVAWRIKEQGGSVRFTEQRPSDGCIRAHGYIVTPLYTRPTPDLAERIEELVEANQRLRNGYADAVSGLQYILARHGRLDGVGFDRVLDHFFEWVTMPEREGLQAGSHKLAALKEMNSHDRT